MSAFPSLAFVIFHVCGESKPLEVISQYHRILIGSSDLQLKNEAPVPGTVPAVTDVDAAAVSNSKNRWGSKEVEITGVVFLDNKGNETNFIKCGEQFRVRIHYRAYSKVEKPVFGVAIYSDRGVHITGPNTKKQGFPIDAVEGEGVVEYEAESLPLLPGTYLFSAAVYDSSMLQPYDHWEQHWKFHVIESEAVVDRYGLITMPARWSIKHGKRE